MVMVESPALSQLVDYARNYPNKSVPFAETVSGIVYPTLTGSLRVGKRTEQPIKMISLEVTYPCKIKTGHRGPVLLSDAFLIEKMQLFNRERIPERVVHSKGAGVFRVYFKTMLTTFITFSTISLLLFRCITLHCSIMYA